MRERVALAHASLREEAAALSAQGRGLLRAALSPARRGTTAGERDSRMVTRRFLIGE